jgi:hypothetical protein
VPALAFDGFVFTHRAIEERRIRLGYALTAGRGERIDFEETLDLPPSLGPLAPTDAAAEAVLAGLHLAAGTSYWKTCLPLRFVLDAPLSEEGASFWNRVYTLGLAEFFYKNGIDPAAHRPFRPAGPASPIVPARAAEGPPLVLWGGGKDSVVSHEVLRMAAEPHELLTIGRAWEPVRRSAGVAGAVLHVAERRIDPKLLALNEAGALNGHVPVSAYLAFAGVLIALIARRPAVIASNEASASSGSTTWHGIDVNHQWSKSLEFERMMRAWLARHVEGGPEYVSLLRPLSELRITKAFATHPAYFASVSSCNGNFRQGAPAAGRWCLTCPKCVFVALMARPFVDDAAYHILFGGDPLSDPANATHIEELLGLRGVKPFECVGTPDETAAALHLAKAAGRFLPHGVMTVFNEGVARAELDLDATTARALARGALHELTSRRLGQLDAYLDRH